MKKYIKNKKGFTLVELLAVVVILGILSSIAVIAVTTVKKKTDIENTRNMVSSILTGAKQYVADNPNTLGELPASVEISSLDKYAEYDFSKTDNNINDSTEVKISKCENGDKLLYTFDYSFTIDGKTIEYNDCGCEEQSTGTADKLCEDIN